MRRYLQTAVVIPGIALLVYLGVWAVRTLVADRIVAAVTTQSQEANRRYLAAARWRPDEAELWRQAAATALTNPRSAQRWVRHALTLEPRDWQAWQTLALLQLEENDMTASRHSLEEATHWSHSFAAHYALANLAFLQGDKPLFWQQTVQALAIAPADQVASALARTLRLSGRSAEDLASVLPHERASITLAASNYFLRTHELEAATQAWQLTGCQAVAVHIPCIFTLQRLMDAWIAQALPERGTAQHQAVTMALQLWNQGVTAGLLRQPRQQWGEFADGNLLWNWLGPSFSWTVDTPSVTMETASEASQPHRRSLQMHFSGSEPERMSLMHHYLPVAGGRRYRLSFRTQRLGAGAGSGIEVSVSAGGGNVPSNRLAPVFDRRWTANAMEFRVPPNMWLIEVSIAYSRPMGETLLQGTMAFDHFQLRSLSADDHE